MTISNITAADIESVLDAEDLDAALFPLQELALIDDGGIASQVFSGHDDQDRDSYQQWTEGDHDARRTMIKKWIEVERLYEE